MVEEVVAHRWQVGVAVVLATGVAMVVGTAVAATEMTKVEFPPLDNVAASSAIDFAGASSFAGVTKELRTWVEYSQCQTTCKKLCIKTSRYPSDSTTTYLLKYSQHCIMSFQLGLVS